jgi:hypothetical protein
MQLEIGQLDFNRKKILDEIDNLVSMIISTGLYVLYYYVFYFIFILFYLKFNAEMAISKNKIHMSIVELLGVCKEEFRMEEKV